MVQLLKIKEQIYQFVGRNETFLLAAVKFVIAYVAFYMINHTLDFNDVLAEYPIALILALLCCFLPTGLMLFFGAALILVQLYGASLELCAIMALIFVILFCVYFRFSTRKGLYTVLTALLGHWGIPFVMPVSAGLLSQPYTSISVVCGTVVYFVLKNVNENRAMFASLEELTSKSIITMFATQIFNDTEMYLYLIAFVVTTIVVFCIRKLSADHARHAAIIVGIVVQMVVICCGEIYFGNAGKLIPVIIGCLVSLAILFVINFMTMSLDYSRAEHLQFEDDEYYYYVKAIPKSYVSADDKKVQTINEKKKPQEKTKKVKKGKKVVSSKIEKK